MDADQRQLFDEIRQMKGETPQKKEKVIQEIEKDLAVHKAKGERSQLVDIVVQLMEEHRFLKAEAARKEKELRRDAERLNEYLRRYGGAGAGA
ncbi:uncharacterized protein I303_105792 [Kwoniella dejecticola CBS 10117]|uniref:Uncharacterized protein n=1 Tax=Kwoniella dejecticola CBS 10117 TaxID=1296121 RepID=A0A1A6A0D5_9TREE|nr:uncharacterized protein I303_05814 [Kwoniella dejecticola CBS 10117]OBR83534.1 hypothetical protein I303_05814 [Kwoniella dejecticola CBS 10117]